MVAIHFSNLGLFFAMNSAATVKRASLSIIKNVGDNSIAQAIIGLASSTPFDIAYSVKKASATLHA